MEYMFFVKWMWRRKKVFFVLRNTLFRLIVKLQSKFISNILFYYPREIRRIIPSFISSEEIHWNFISDHVSLNKNDLSADYSITLATQSMLIRAHDGIPWDCGFADPEDEESLHRWNWLLY